MNLARTVCGALAAAILTCAPAFADPAPTATASPVRTSAGIQGLLATGVHSDAAGTQSGIGGGPLIQISIVPSRRWMFHAEGIPVVGIPQQRASSAYGAATPSLGVVNASLRFALDANARYWIGAGTTIINQRTPLPAQNSVVSSRLSGGRYELFARLPQRNGRFVEFSAGGAPRLWGSDKYIYSDGTPALDKDEKAAEEDVSLAWGIQRSHSEILLGLRSINFSAVFTKTGLAADRNNGAGIMLEWRRYIGGP